MQSSSLIILLVGSILALIAVLVIFLIKTPGQSKPQTSTVVSAAKVRQSRTNRTRTVRTGVTRTGISSPRPREQRTSPLLVDGVRSLDGWIWTTNPQANRTWIRRAPVGFLDKIENKSGVLWGFSNQDSNSGVYVFCDQLGKWLRLASGRWTRVDLDPTSGVVGQREGSDETFVLLRKTTNQ